MKSVADLQEELSALKTVDAPSELIKSIEAALRKMGGPEPIKREEKKRLTFDDFQGVYLETFGEVEKRYRAGALDRMEKNDPMLWARIKGLEERINCEWIALGNLVQFEKWVKEWGRLMLSGIRRFGTGGG